MRSFLIIFLIVLSYVPSFLYCQDDEYKVFKHQALGIEFKYSNNDYFSDERRIKLPISKWKIFNVPQFKLQIKLPPGLVVKIKPAHVPQVGPICDSSFFKYAADIVSTKGNKRELGIHMYFSNHNFPGIARINDFVYSLKDENDLFVEDSTSWDIDSGQMGRDRADYLDGTRWKGLRGSAFSRSGQYTQQYMQVFLVYEYCANCNLVVTYNDSQLYENVLSETEFYDIIASIKFNE
jgi:hypothetical protein